MFNLIMGSYITLGVVLGLCIGLHVGRWLERVDSNTLKIYFSRELEKAVESAEINEDGVRVPYLPSELIEDLKACYGADLIEPLIDSKRSQDNQNPKQDPTLSFSVLEALRAGKKVRPYYWSSDYIYMDENGDLRLPNKEGTYPWAGLPCEGQTDDWEILEESEEEKTR